MSDVVTGHPLDASTSRVDADVWLLDRARRVVSAHLSTRDDADFARSVKSMIEKTVHEYDGRFLFELIQNGYDKQSPEKRSGLLAITLMYDELRHGVLYVANTGHGFTPSNVRAIANLGLSDKEIGEGIGNKGVGFKSVLQICESPEIYSTSSDGSAGFCFRFARSDDIPGLVDDDPVRVQQVLDEMSFYSITVPAEDTPTQVTAFWEQGYSTVIRLPLRDDARDLVVERMQELTRSESPVMLFLRRLKQITIRHESAEAESEKVLTRALEQAPDLHANLQSEIVVLDGDMRYLVLTHEVPHEAVATAVRQAVEGHRLDPKWEGSTAPTEVSIAVPLDVSDVIAGRYYTYLPLGAKAPSPFAGHLNAPFSTNLARTDVETSNPLNRLLLAAAASLCLNAAAALTKWDKRAPESVLDLITWDVERVSVLEHEATSQGLPLAKRALIPSREAGRWTSMEDARRWHFSGTKILTAARASSACHVDFLPEIAEGRAKRFHATMGALGLSADPPLGQLASWVETMFDAMLDAKRPLPEWDQAYADIAVIFARHPAALGSRRILLTDDWQLRACASGSRMTDALSPREPTPFFPPARQRVDEEDDVDPDADLDLPKSLSRRLFYLHSGLTWYTNRQQTPARSFLQNNRLVRRSTLEASLSTSADSWLALGRKPWHATPSDSPLI